MAAAVLGSESLCVLDPVESADHDDLVQAKGLKRPEWTAYNQIVAFRLDFDPILYGDLIP